MQLYISQPLGLLCVGTFGITQWCSEVPLEIVVWIYNTYDNNLRIENDFTKYLKKSCW